MNPLQKIEIEKAASLSDRERDSITAADRREAFSPPNDFRATRHPATIAASNAARAAKRNEPVSNQVNRETQRFLMARLAAKIARDETQKGESK